VTWRSLGQDALTAHPSPLTVLTSLASTALIVIDVQPDFLPGGALAVADGDAILAPLAALVEHVPFGVVVATQDWHPAGHASFASAHPGTRPFDVVELHGNPQTLWPDHCVQDTAGAALHPVVPAARVSAVIRKGTQPDVDSYSGFRNNWDARGDRPPTGLAGYLRERGVDHVVLCGLARDFCVKWSAEDAAAAGFRATVLWQLTRPVVPASDAQVRADLQRAGVAVVDELPASANR
jgi:nicotinamidase/pyrazinamidase